MNAPDKIYVTPVRTWDTKHISDLQDNIYISKDALLELLKPEKDICFCDDYERGCIDGRNSLREELLDKLNEM